MTRLRGTCVADGLREEGHAVDLIADGSGGLVRATTVAYDLLIVDRMLPSLVGVSLVRTLRGTKSPVPILLLTSQDGVDDRIEGLNAGADDYLVKPFAFGELSAQVAALGPRPPPAVEATWRTTLR